MTDARRGRRGGGIPEGLRQFGPGRMSVLNHIAAPMWAWLIIGASAITGGFINCFLGLFHRISRDFLDIWGALGGYTPEA